MATQKNAPSSFPFGKGSLMPQEEMLERKKQSRQLVIGIPREQSENESRVGLTPEAVELLVDNGHQLLIETQAGKGANYKDTDYSECGGFILDDHTEIFKRSDIILKISPPTLHEIEYLKGNQIIISALHLPNQSESYIRNMMAKKMTAIAFEHLRNKENYYPVVRSMSEIAGSTSILIAAEYLSNQNNGKGVMLGGIPGITPTEVVILGAGTVAESAARAAIGLGAFVKVFDNSVDRLRRLQSSLGQRLYTSIFHPRVVLKALKSADVVIGAIHPNQKMAPFYITEQMVMQMKAGSVIVDVSIDQGGCVETSECRSQKNPVYIRHGVIHYCVPNIPSRVSRTASIALSNVFSPLLIRMSEAGSLRNLLMEDLGIRKGVYLYNGLLTNATVGRNFGIPSKDIDLLMAAF
jgi:alanine dehydrogenase